RLRREEAPQPRLRAEAREEVEQRVLVRRPDRSDRDVGVVGERPRHERRTLPGDGGPPQGAASRRTGAAVRTRPDVPGPGGTTAVRAGREDPRPARDGAMSGA